MAQLRCRVAAGREIAGPLDTAGVKAKFLVRHALDDAVVDAWLAALERDRPWLDETLRREAAFEQLASEAASDDARDRKLGAMAMSLARVEMDTLALGSEAAAKEAVEKRDRIPPYDPGKPCEIEADFADAGFAERYRHRHGVEIADGRTVVSRADDWWTAWRQFYF